MEGLDSPSVKQRRSKDRKKGDLPEDAEDDEFFKKWSGPVLIGPILPAIFSLIVIVIGQLVLNTWTGTCGYALDCKIFHLYSKCLF
jgi:hypothetical protein